MRHYSLEKWVDFARNVIDEGEKVKMQSHLQTGCTACSKELRMWQRLQQVARRESVYAPPEGTVRTVNASFANRSAGQLRHAKSEAITLLFDSFRSPLLAGVRSAESASQQLLYGVGDYRIDVRIEPQMDSEKVVVIGQVLNCSDPDERLAAAPVSLFTGRKMLAESVTSEFGEFQIECELAESFRLVVLLADGKQVSIPLVEPGFTTREMPTHVAENNILRKSSRIKKKQY
jgi:hypothetical protein